MALPALTSAAEDFRGRVQGFADDASRQIEAALAGVDPWDVDAVRDALITLLPVVGGDQHDVAATYAADWYQLMRGAAGAPGSADPDLAPRPGTARWEALARWGVDPLLGLDPDMPAALDRVTGGMQRTIADGARDTLRLATVRDPAAEGWKRLGRGECDFCRMLIGRGAVYTAATATFASHDRCRCMAAPVFAKGVDPVAVNDYVGTDRRLTPEARAANNARVRAYIQGA